MNCKPGDLAVIVGGSEWSGWIVEVLCVAYEDIVAPDGVRFACGGSDRWLIKAPRSFGKRPFTKTCYAVAPDWGLRPLRDPGEDAQDETLSWLPVPLPQLEPA